MSAPAAKCRCLCGVVEGGAVHGVLGQQPFGGGDFLACGCVPPEEPAIRADAENLLGVGRELAIPPTGAHHGLELLDGLAGIGVEKLDSFVGGKGEPRRANYLVRRESEVGEHAVSPLFSRKAAQ